MEQDSSWDMRKKDTTGAFKNPLKKYFILVRMCIMFLYSY